MGQLLELLTLHRRRRREGWPSTQRCIVVGGRFGPRGSGGAAGAWAREEGFVGGDGAGREVTGCDVEELLHSHLGREAHVPRRLEV
jgi:hypothetical protein